MARIPRDRSPDATPRAADTLRTGDDADVEAFVQEVRRFYPFFPVVGGRATEPFEWRGHRFRKGQWVLFGRLG